MKIVGAHAFKALLMSAAGLSVSACASGGGVPRVENIRPMQGATAESQIAQDFRSEEHTSELQSLMRISYAVFCLKKKNYPKKYHVSALRKPQAFLLSIIVTPVTN